MTINISELEALRAKMTPGEYEVWTSNSFRRITASGGPDGGVLRGEIQRHDDWPDLAGQNRDADLAGLCAEHNAMPALITAIKAALAYRDAVQSRPGRRYRNSVEDAERDLYAALEAVTL